MVFRTEPQTQQPPPNAAKVMMAASSTANETPPFKPHHKPLHNFPLQDLKWSMNQSSTTSIGHPRSGNKLVSSSSSAVIDDRKRKSVGGEEDQIEDKKKANKLFIRIRAKSGNVGNKPADEPAELAVASPSPRRPPIEEDVDVAEAEEELPVGLKTWNLRPRRAVTKAPNPNYNSNGGRGEEVGSSRARNGGDGSEAKKGGKEKEKEKKEKKKKEEEMMRLSIPLTKEEIEEDIFILTGCKPSRRPKKRVKHIQKQLDCVFPGLWLDWITPESYRVNDP